MASSLTRVCSPVINFSLFTAETQIMKNTDKIMQNLYCFLLLNRNRAMELKITNMIIVADTDNNGIKTKVVAIEPVTLPNVSTAIKRPV